MKKLLIFMILFVLSLSVTSCSGSENDSPTSVAREQAEEILRCLDENDIEGLKSMFCKQVCDTHNLDEEILEAMEFYDGETISHNKILVGGGEAVDNGVLTDVHIGYTIDNVKTNAGMGYSIVTHSYLIYNKNPECIGITYLKVCDEDEEEVVQIGEYVY